MIDGFRVKLPQVLGFGVCIRERLKIDDELMRIETFPDIFDAFADLIANGICLDRRGWPERIVVAVSAAADRHCAVAIRASESPINDDLVNAFAEFFLQPTVIGAESLGLG